jgi:uncharacterized protein YjbI with pentapeptide repeats
MNRTAQLAARFCLGLLLVASAAHADIFQWEYIPPGNPIQGIQQSTTLAPDGAGVDAVPGAELSGLDLTMAYLPSADLTDANLTFTNLTNAFLRGAALAGANLRQANLSGASFGRLCDPCYGANLAGADLSGASLSNANFTYAVLAGADFSGAIVRGASFANTTAWYLGFTPAQLYSTASYQAGDLSGTKWAWNILDGWTFAGQNLTNSAFWSDLGVAILTGADFTGTDLRGASFFEDSAPINDNLIGPEGHIRGLELEVSQLLVVRDYDGDGPQWWRDSISQMPITNDQHLTMGPGGTLRMVFEADEWDSTISFADGIPVNLGGTLELAFAAYVDVTTQVGRTFDLFDWTGVIPSGAFTVSGPYSWNLSTSTRRAK